MLTHPAGAAGGAEPHAGRLVGEHVDAIFKMVYGSTFNTAIQALQVFLRVLSCSFVVVLYNLYIGLLWDLRDLDAGLFSDPS